MNKATAREKMDISNLSTLNNIEKDIIPSVKSMIKIAELYDISLHDLCVYYCQKSMEDRQMKFQSIRRQQSEITTKMLAANLEMSEEQYLNYEKRPSTFPLDSILKLVRIFNVDMSLFRDIESRFEYNLRLKSLVDKWEKLNRVQESYTALITTISYYSHLKNTKQKYSDPYLGFIRNDSGVIFLFTDVHYKDDCRDAVFSDFNDNIISVNLYTIVENTVSYELTGDSTETFRFDSNVPLLPTIEQELYQLGKSVEYHRTQIFTENYKNPYSKSRDILDEKYRQTIHLTFFRKTPRFISDYEYLNRNRRDSKSKADIKYSIDNNYFGDNLYHFLNANDLSANEVSEALGVGESVVSNWKTYSTIPQNVDLLLSLALITGVTVDELLFEKIQWKKRRLMTNVGINTLFQNIRDVYSFIKYLEVLNSVLVKAKSYSIEIKSSDRKSIDLVKDILFDKDGKIVFICSNRKTISFSIFSIRPIYNTNENYIIEMRSDADDEYSSYELTFQIIYPLLKNQKNQRLSLFTEDE